jgi:ABC-type transport system involved in multi-copper enzyme maturation permease subunit
MTGFSGFLRGVGLVVALELRQRLRGVAWYIILGVFFALIALVTIGVWIVTGTWGQSGGALFSSIVYFVLLLATLITPALSGNAINGEREGGTLATMQVTALTTGHIVVGKWLASWIASLALLVVTLPFLAIAVGIGEVSAMTVVSSLAVLVAELGALSAIGVGLSGVIRKPLFSVVVTYLAVAALTIGTLIAFALAGSVTQVQVTTTTVSAEYDEEGNILGCGDTQTYTSSVSRFDPYWGLLVINPYVVVADASYGDFDVDGNPANLFGYISLGVREVQKPVETEVFYDYCELGTATYAPNDIDGDGVPDPTAEEVLRSGTPNWFIGLGLQAVLGALALWGAWRATRTPAGRLAAGSRVA